MTATVESLAPRPASLALSRLPLSRVVGFIGLFAMLVVVAAVAALVLTERNRLTGEATREASSNAMFLADHASRLFEAADFAIRQAMAEAQGRPWDEIERSHALWEQLDALVRDLPYVDAIWLNDATGRLRLTTIGFPTPPSNAADRDFFIAHAEPNDTLYVSHLIVGRVTNEPTFLLSRRLSEADGVLRGIASVTADIGYFGSFWSRLESRFAPQVTLLRSEDLDVLVQQPDLGVGAEPLAALSAAVRDGGDAGMLFGDALGGGDAILAYHRVGQFPLHLTVSVSAAAIDAQWRSEVIPYGVVGAAAILALAGLTLWAFRQARRQAHSRAALARIVDERTADLTAAKAQLQTLLDELNHRVKNHLQVVTSLLRLESQRIDDPRLRRSLDDSVQRIQAMALLHQQLAQVEAQTGLAFGAYLRQLAANLTEVYGAGGRIVIEIQADGTCLDLQTGTPLALIVNEVISNALKYAYPAGHSGRVVVRLTSGEGHCELVVEDDGIGLPGDHDWRKSTGVGMRIVRSLAGQLDGIADYGGTRGTRFSLRFPLPDAWKGAAGSA